MLHSISPHAQHFMTSGQAVKAQTLIAHARLYAFSDRFVILGNHRDAWVFGGVDPNSGTAALMELARALSDLRSKGKLTSCSLPVFLNDCSHMQSLMLPV